MPDQAGDPAAAQARAVERLTRRVDGIDTRVGELGDQLTQLAQDIARSASARPQKPPATPPPSWLAERDPAAASELLRDLIAWLDAVYLRYPGAALPTCWAWHPWAVEELAWLAAAHRAAYDPETGTVAAAAEWHERWRPGVAKRLTAAVGGCELSEHQPGRPEARQAPTAPLQHAHDALAFAWTREQNTPEPSDYDLERAAEHDQQHHARF